MSELVKTTLDHDSTDMLIDKWLEYRNAGQDAYYEWFRDVRERKHSHATNQIIAWNKGEFLPENIFVRTIDTGRLIPLDRTWTTHVYHHHSMQDRKLSMMRVVFTIVRFLTSIPLKEIFDGRLFFAHSFLNLCSFAECMILDATRSTLLSLISKSRK